ncbi:PsiF family protein [Dyella sp. 2HG41-7]|uniref:PsiF family protein n=1 Tax=Dyella sp. 2HG41-7 TaxID=2883239 RepID=UPI001F44B7A6|nr:PsiF family protein [Dyella sp. 2HG41-7]
MSMRFSLLAASAALVFATASFATTPQSTAASGKTMSSSQQKMADCSHAAKGKTGADYKSSVSACMKGDTAAAAPAADTKMTSQQRMSACAKENAGKKGADYKSAVSACMKSH